MSIATADGRFGTAADAPRPSNATSATDSLPCQSGFPSSWSRVRIPSPAPDGRQFRSVRRYRSLKPSRGEWRELVSCSRRPPPVEARRQLHDHEQRDDRADGDRQAGEAFEEKGVGEE